VGPPKASPGSFVRGKLGTVVDADLHKHFKLLSLLVASKVLLALEIQMCASSVSKTATRYVLRYYGRGHKYCRWIPRNTLYTLI
jgi:hypothetical protein